MFLSIERRRALHRLKNRLRLQKKIFTDCIKLQRYVYTKRLKIAISFTICKSVDVPQRFYQISVTPRTLYGATTGIY